MSRSFQSRGSIDAGFLLQKIVAVCIPYPTPHSVMERRFVSGNRWLACICSLELRAAHDQRYHPFDRPLDQQKRTPVCLPDLQCRSARIFRALLLSLVSTPLASPISDPRLFITILLLFASDLCLWLLLALVVAFRCIHGCRVITSRWFSILCNRGR